MRNVSICVTATHSTCIARVYAGILSSSQLQQLSSQMTSQVHLLLPAVRTNPFIRTVLWNFFIFIKYSSRSSRYHPDGKGWVGGVAYQFYCCFYCYSYCCCHSSFHYHQHQRYKQFTAISHIVHLTPTATNKSLIIVIMLLLDKYFVSQYVCTHN